ncbi:MAG TPA: FliH/SctL family protein [Bryobacteraceae bacterium]|nr:FliH/SctL family protein [Bryobacteraceae bacterium]
MSSRVLTETKTTKIEPVHWIPAAGEPVNGAAGREEAGGRPEPAPAQKPGELENALQRVQMLERRVHELEAELPRRQQQGREEGRAEGERSGAAAANAAVQPLLDRMTASIGELASYRARFRRESEPELLRLSIAIAKKIVRRELTIDPHTLLGILKAALELINQAEVLSVRMSPEDVALIGPRVAKLGLPDKVEVTPDRTLERGAVVIDTRRGQIDASIQTQLAEIENGFADRIAMEKPR